MMSMNTIDPPAPSKYSEEERQVLQEATKQWRNLQAQIQFEKARTGQLDPKAPQRTSAQLAAVQLHVKRLWEEGGRLRQIAPDAELPCELCKGARWVRNGNSNPPAAIPCPTCFHPWYAEQIRRRWRLTEEEYKQGRKAFLKREDAPEMAAIFKTVKAFGRKVVAGKADTLAITGDVGIGKTHLMLLLHRHVDKANRAVIYRTASHIRTLLQSFDTISEERRTVAMNDMRRVPLLILDEAEKGLREPKDDSDKGAWFNGQILDLINARHNAGLATAIAGNNLFLLPRPILSRLQAKGCDFINAGQIADARPLLGGSSRVTEPATPQE
jgi:hypothetical protein